MGRTSVFYEHNRVVSDITVTEEGIFHINELPDDISGAELDVEIVHEVQLSDREGNLIVLHFNVPQAMDEDRSLAAYANKTRNFSDPSSNTMPSGLFTTDIKDIADGYRSLLQFPSGAE